MPNSQTELNVIQQLIDLRKEANDQNTELRREMTNGFQHLGKAIEETSRTGAETSKMLAVAMTEFSRDSSAVNVRIDTSEKLIEDVAKATIDNGIRLEPLEKFKTRFNARVGVLGSVVSLAWLGFGFWYVQVYQPQQAATLVTTTAVEAIEDQTTAILNLSRKLFPEESDK